MHVFFEEDAGFTGFNSSCWWYCFASLVLEFFEFKVHDRDFASVPLVGFTRFHELGRTSGLYHAPSRFPTGSSEILCNRKVCKDQGARCRRLGKDNSSQNAHPMA